jgi:hypothetical protein
VDDVRVLVRGQVVEPVVGVAQDRGVGRRRRVEDDLVARHHVGEAIGPVGVVVQHDLGLAGRLVAQRRGQGGVRALGRHRHLARHVAERLVVVNLEVRGLDGAPDQRRIAGPRVLAAEADEAGDRQRGDRSTPAHRGDGGHGTAL